MDSTTKRKIEAILFASGRFIDAKKIASFISVSEKEAVIALRELQDEYNFSQSALHILEEDEAWKLHVRNEFLELISKVISDTEISGPVTETLAVIAWRSPVLQSEVIEIRGSNAYEHVKELVERNFIIKEPEGRSYRLRITEKFFDYFDIEGREDIRKVFAEVEHAYQEKKVDVDIAQKRVKQAITKAQQKKEIHEPKESKNLEDLDAVLERSRQKREEIEKEIQTQKKIVAEEKEIQLDEAQTVREKVEKQIEDIK